MILREDLSDGATSTIRSAAVRLMMFRQIGWYGLQNKFALIMA